MSGKGMHMKKRRPQPYPSQVYDNLNTTMEKPAPNAHTPNVVLFLPPFLYRCRSSRRNMSK